MFIYGQNVYVVVLRSNEIWIIYSFAKATTAGTDWWMTRFEAMITQKFIHNMYDNCEYRSVSIVVPPPSTRAVTSMIILRHPSTVGLNAIKLDAVHVRMPYECSAY